METGRRDVGRRKGLQEVHFRQGGDWSMWDPLALLTGHVWSLKYLQLPHQRSMHTLGGFLFSYLNETNHNVGNQLINLTKSRLIYFFLPFFFSPFFNASFRVHLK